MPDREPYRIRKAEAGDQADFLRLVEELARFERLEPPGDEARMRLSRQAFGPRPAFEVFLAHAASGGPAVAYAILLWTYSSFLAKPTLYIEDLYITPDHRSKGLGRAFMAFLGRRALKRGAGRIEGIVLAWNEEARRFYRSTGAKELTDWVFFRYDEEALHDLARHADPP